MTTDTTEAVERFRPAITRAAHYENRCHMVADGDGAWVAFDDYRALAAENAALREQVKAERLANGHEKRLRLEAIALHQTTEAERDALRAEVERVVNIAAGLFPGGFDNNVKAIRAALDAKP